MAYSLTHPDSDQEIQVDAERVPLYVQQGWQIKPGATPPEKSRPKRRASSAATPQRPSPERGSQ